MDWTRHERDPGPEGVRKASKHRNAGCEEEMAKVRLPVCRSWPVARLVPEKCFAQRQAGGGREKKDTQETRYRPVHLAQLCLSLSQRRQTLGVEGAFPEAPSPFYFLAFPCLSWPLAEHRYVPETDTLGSAYTEVWARCESQPEMLLGTALDMAETKATWAMGECRLCSNLFLPQGSG